MNEMLQELPWGERGVRKEVVSVMAKWHAVSVVLPLSQECTELRVEVEMRVNVEHMQAPVTS